jgi:hypothetical protein
MHVCFGELVVLELFSSDSPAFSDLPVFIPGKVKASRWPRLCLSFGGQGDPGGSAWM